MSLRSNTRTCALALLVCALASCGQKRRSLEQQAEVTRAPAALTSAQAAEKPVEQAVADREPVTPRVEASGVYPRPGFSKVAIENEAPLCVFASLAEQYPVNFIDYAKQQTLPVDSSVAIGVFSPWCVNEACDLRPSLQCQVTREGNTLVVHSRYWGDHKDGAICKEGCRSITAACQTPKLERGKYTIQYGDKKFSLRIPSVLRDPCFGAKKAKRRPGP